MLLYVLPLAGFEKNNKTVIFVIAIFLAYFFYNMVHPLKINWFMSLVDDKMRGRFTANKEIVSLICGMMFTLFMGALVDHFKSSGDIRKAFIICAIVMFILMVLHTLMMVLSVEKPSQNNGKGNALKQFAFVLKDTNVRKVILLFIIWNMASYSTIPFYGTYMIKELGFSLKFVSILSIVYSMVRIFVSRFWGRYADRNSFAVMIRLCFLVMACGFLINAFAMPSNGKVIFVLFNIFHGIALGGINSALVNLVFDYAPVEMRSDALATSQATSGVVGFLTTLVTSSLVAYIQNNGNKLFGMRIFAQQVTSLIAFAFTIAAAIYVHTQLTGKE
jgi:predicted MFS family arabinose efflux permease